MNELKVFESPEFGKIRTVEVDGEPWLVGKDVARALGYSNTKQALSAHVDEDDKRIIQRSGAFQQALVRQKIQALGHIGSSAFHSQEWWLHCRSGTAF